MYIMQYPGEDTWWVMTKGDMINSSTKIGPYSSKPEVTKKFWSNSKKCFFVDILHPGKQSESVAITRLGFEKYISSSDKKEYLNGVKPREMYENTGSKERKLKIKRKRSTDDYSVPLVQVCINLLCSFFILCYNFWFVCLFILFEVARNSGYTTESGDPYGVHIWGGLAGLGCVLFGIGGVFWTVEHVSRLFGND